MSYSLVPKTILDINFGNIKWFISKKPKNISNLLLFMGLFLILTHF